MAVAKAHLSGSAKADGLCHEGTAKSTAASPSPSPRMDPIPWHSLPVGTGPPPIPSISGSLQPSWLWHPWQGDSELPCLFTPLPNQHLPFLAGPRSTGSPGRTLPPTHLLGGEWHADAVLLDEHGGTGTAGRGQAEASALVVAQFILRGSRGAVRAGRWCSPVSCTPIPSLHARGSHPIPSTGDFMSRCHGSGVRSPVGEAAWVYSAGDTPAPRNLPWC